MAYGIAAVDPGLFGLGPIPAVKQALTRAGWSNGDVERIEINEAFAAIALAVIGELGVAARHRECRGWRHGAWSSDRGDRCRAHDASSSIRCAATALKRGVVTLCIGGGQGIALALEMIT